MSSYLVEESTFFSYGQRDEFYDEVYGDLCQDYDFLCPSVSSHFSISRTGTGGFKLVYFPSFHGVFNVDLRQIWCVARRVGTTGSNRSGDPGTEEVWCESKQNLIKCIIY